MTYFNSVVIIRVYCYVLIMPFFDKLRKVIFLILYTDFYTDKPRQHSGHCLILLAYHKLESRLLGEISITSDMQMIPLTAESKEELKNLLMRVKDESEKAGLKLNTKKN